MITLGTARKTRKVLDAVAEASQPGVDGRLYEVRFGLYAGGADLSGKLEEAEWGQTEIPITLDATLSGSLPDRLKEAPATLIAEVEGEPIHQVIGAKSITIPNDEAHREDFLTSSAGSLLAGDDAIKLGRQTDYAAEAPHRIVFDVVRRLPYDRNRFDIQPIPGVQVSFSGSTENPGFLPHEPTGEVLSRLSNEGAVGYDYRDTAQNGFVAWVPTPLSRTSPEEGQDKSYLSQAMPDWLVSRPLPPVVRYHSVRVYATDEAGNVTFEVIQEIPYPEGTVVPHRGRTLDLPFEDASEDFAHNARKYAVNRALEEARATYTGEALLPCFDPTIERSDGFRVDETHKDDDGLWHILWGMRIASYKHLLAATSGSTEGGVLATQVAYSATILSKERIDVPTFVYPSDLRPRGIVPTPPLYGVNGDELFFDTALPWVTTSGDDLIFYDNSAGALTVSGDDLIVSA